jgi:hypothetical protein
VRLNVVRWRLSICVSSVRKLLRAILLAPGILWWLLDLWEICAALPICVRGSDKDNFTFLCDKMVPEDINGELARTLEGRGLSKHRLNLLRE